MPLYEYRVEATGEVVEVVHRMSERFSTWGEVCTHMKRELGDVPADSAVSKLVGSGNASNAPWTVGKQLKADGAKSMSIQHQATVSPMRNKNF